MKKQERTTVNTNSAPNDFHVYLKPGTAEWLRAKVNRDAPTVPAVIREIVEEAQRKDSKKSRD